MTHTEKIELLEKYSMWLTKNGYMDTDWMCENPFAIDEFLIYESGGKIKIDGK